jgi:hypothetical protein
MTWMSLERINRYGPLAVSFVLLAAAACADTGFSLSAWLVGARFFTRLRILPPRQ